MEIFNKDYYGMSDIGYLRKIGDFIRSERISQNRTQAELAESAGVNRSTVVQIEKGNSVTLLSFIQILRSLRQLGVLHTMETTPVVSPLQVAAEEQQKIKRVRHKKNEQKPLSDW